MPTITFNLHQWGVAFGILGNFISFLVYLAPVPTFYRIYRKKTTENFQSLPYLVALFSSMLWCYYALVKKNAFLLITINSFGCVIETIYLILFITYAPKDSRKSTIRIFAAMNVGVFSLIFLITYFLVSGSTRIVILGWICVAFSVSVFAAPLSVVAQVIRTRSVEFMPFNLSFFLTLSAIMWFAYGVFEKDICVALPNIVGFLLGLIQMVLYAIYKNADCVMLKDKKSTEVQLKNIMILGNLGNSEVHPVVDIHLDIDDGNGVKEEAKGSQEQTDQQESRTEEETKEKSLEVSNHHHQLQQQNNDECAVIV